MVILWSAKPFLDKDSFFRTTPIKERMAINVQFKWYFNIKKNLGEIPFIDLTVMYMSHKYSFFYWWFTGNGMPMISSLFLPVKMDFWSSQRHHIFIQITSLCHFHRLPTAQYGLEHIAQSLIHNFDLLKMSR